MHPHPFELAPIARRVWQDKYRFAGDTGSSGDDTVNHTWTRIARAAASSEAGGEKAQQKWQREFEGTMADFAFLPAGRIIAGAGTGRDVTLFNCFVMGNIADDLTSIFDNVKEAALTMQLGGGIGHDFSTLRPNGATVASIGADASGPVSFMRVWDAMCRTIMSAGARRGAMMGTLRCDHPDIEMFIDAKAEVDELRNFNLSVLVTDAFVDAVRTDADWPLVFNGRTYKTVRASALWDRIMRATYDYAEPGVIFIDRVNANNNLAYREDIGCTNPCGEQPLPPYGACLLGSVNLTRFVTNPFEQNSGLDLARLEQTVHVAIRFLDNIIDVSKYPLPAQRKEAKAKRRIGLGVTGLADALVMCGKHYGEEEARVLAASWMEKIQTTAYLASAELAAEKGAFPLFDADGFLGRPNIKRLESAVGKAIEQNGIRNGCLTSIAPTGTISLLAGNVSSGIEPIFASSYERRVLERDGNSRTESVVDYARALHEHVHGNAKLPPTFVTAQELTPGQHVAMQAALQPFVDSSISKTINCPADVSFEDFKSIYAQAHAMGLKGCTTYRPNAITGAVLATTEPSAKSSPAKSSPGNASNDVVAHAVTTETGAIDAPNSPTAAAQSQVAGGIGINPVQPSSPVPSTQVPADIVMLTKPLDREVALPGFTYKLKWPDSPDAIYVTINDIEQAGRRRPFEIFINTKNLEHYAWTVALTRMISAVFRRGGDVSFVVDELKAIFDPQGGRWVDGRYVPSLLAAIGEIIEAHMLKNGFLKPDSQSTTVEGSRPKAVGQSAPQAGTASSAGRSSAPIIRTRTCPNCAAAGLIRSEGCWICQNCGYSHCG